MSLSTTRELTWTDTTAASTAAPPEAPSPAQADPTRLVTARGVTAVSETAVAKVAQYAVNELPGVKVLERGGIGRVAGRSDSRVSADVDDTDVDLELHLGVEYPRPLRRTVASVDDHVRRRVAALTGLRVRRLHLTVDELPAPDRGRTRRVI